MKQILEFCKEAKTTSEILDYLGLSDRKNLMETYLNRMLEAGMLVMTELETPTSKNLKYRKLLIYTSAMKVRNSAVLFRLSNFFATIQ